MAYLQPLEPWTPAHPWQMSAIAIVWKSSLHLDTHIEAIMHIMKIQTAIVQ